MPFGVWCLVMLGAHSHECRVAALVHLLHTGFVCMNLLCLLLKLRMLLNLILILAHGVFCLVPGTARCLNIITKLGAKPGCSA